MKIESRVAEEEAILQVAREMCAAARTAPKACGVDRLDSAILTGEDKDALSAEMRRIAEVGGDAFFIRDAENVDASFAVVLIGADENPGGWTGSVPSAAGMAAPRVRKTAGSVSSTAWIWALPWAPPSPWPPTGASTTG